jgi:repressor LexA
MTPAPRPLTERQRRVLAEIRSRLEADGRPPTLREIGQALGIASTNGVRDHLQALIDKGYIRRDVRSARGIGLVRGGAVARAREGLEGEGEGEGRGERPVRLVPVLGRVAAGVPVLAEQNIEGHLAVDRDLLRGEGLFALRVQGDSMRDAGILDGDVVFVRKQEAAQPRDIVVALVDEDTTVKRYVPDGDVIRLEPENPAYPPILVEQGSGRFAILGKVAAVLRTIK